MKWVVFDATGRITSSVVSPDIATVSLNLEPGEQYMAGEGGDTTHYVDVMSMQILERQDYTLEALPLPCTVTIEGVAYPITQQPTFEFDSPGDYEIHIDAGPAYLEKIFNVSN